MAKIIEKRLTQPTNTQPTSTKQVNNQPDNNLQPHTKALFILCVNEHLPLPPHFNPFQPTAGQQVEALIGRTTCFHIKDFAGHEKKSGNLSIEI